MKLKTRKSAKKRFKQKKYLIIRKGASTAHFLRRKTRKQLRHLSQTHKVQNCDLKAISQMLPY